MSRYSGSWAPYVPVAERRRKAEREMQKLRKKGVTITPVIIEGRQIARTFWGKAWCTNLESYRDYDSRLPRGRTYVRNGSVVDLQISPREVTAIVSGSAIYKVKVTIKDVDQARWKTLCADCSGGIESLVELLQGQFSKGVMERICRQNTGLFPRPSEIQFTCSCPDHASMCKHIAAVLYAVGARLDQNPELLFRLRAVDQTQLLSDLETVLPDARTERGATKTLAGDDLAALFGLDMAEDGPPLSPTDKAPTARRRPGKGVIKKPDMIATPLAPNRVKTTTTARKNTDVSAKRGRQPDVSPKGKTARPVVKKALVSRRTTSKKTTVLPIKARPATATLKTANRQPAAKDVGSARRETGRGDRPPAPAQLDREARAERSLQPRRPKRVR